MGFTWLASGSRQAALLVAVATFAGCGGERAEDGVRSIAGRQHLSGPVYAPAAETCFSTPPVAPGTVVRTSGYRVCGPFSASAETSTFTCELSEGAMGPYRLLVTNGAPNGGGRVSSAKVKVDGVEVLGPRAFDQQVTNATVPVSLGIATTIDASVSGGGALRLEVVDEGRACTILGPSSVTASGIQASFSSTNALPVPELQLFNGGLDGTSPANKGEVFVNDKLLVSRSEIREKVTAVLEPVTLASVNTLSARAGERGLFTVQVVDRDDTAPRISLDTPTDLAFTRHAQFSVAGLVDDPSAVVTVNGVVASSSGGAFTGTVTLAECWNTIEVRASDVCGNATELRFQVGLDTTPPSLAVMSPPNGLMVNRTVLPVVLRYSDGFSGVDLTKVLVTLDGADVTTALTIGTDTASGSITVAEGEHILRARVTDRAGNQSTEESRFVVDRTAPILTIKTPIEGAQVATPVATTVTYADALSGVDVASLTVTLDGQDVTREFAMGPVSASATLSVVPGSHRLEVGAADLAGNHALASAAFTVLTLGDGLPSDPARVAPPNDPTVATDIASSTAFLYEGLSPIQTGVARGTIEARRVAIIRGQVNGRDGNPVGGVRITILDAPELGSTLTREDGVFDMAVNGGGLLTVNYQKDGYLTAQRKVRAPWRDYVWADEVVLVQFDSQVTPVALGALSAQVVRGSPVSDADGARQATLIFPAGTTASMVLADGTTQPLSSLHVRATEYTVGPTGPKAMPAALPSTSAYTYAVELSVDEAVMAGASSVQFNQPVAFYVENFLGFPAGGIVPAGYYDRTKGVWVPSENGRVVKIVSVTGGLAELDTNGSGTAADSTALAALGVTVEERARLAAAYVPGTSLWRVPITHFSPWDCNWPYGCEGGPASCPPPTPPPPPPAPPDDPCKQSGSIIECETQVLGERTPITGTGLALHYSSRRTRGYAVERRFVIPLVGASVASTIESVILTVDVAGQHHALTFPPSPNLEYTFEWNGRDKYGRDVVGSAEATIGISYLYRPVYLQPAALRASFGAFSSSGVQVGSVGGRTSSFRLVVPIQYTVTIHGAQTPPLGGWSVNVHHSYDFVGRRLLRGDGSQRSAQISDAGVITTVAGNGATNGDRGDGGLATAARLFLPSGVAVGADGTLFIADPHDNRIRRVGPDGLITTVAGTGMDTYDGDGGLATAASLSFPKKVAVGADGALFIADTGNYRIRRVGPDGVITTVAGTGTYGYSGDGGLATAARLSYPEGVAVGADGAVFIADSRNNRIRRVGLDGVITTVAGTGAYGYAGDGGSATAARLHSPEGVAVGADGALFIADTYNNRIRRVGADGVITTVAGADTLYGYSGDGGPATAAKLSYPEGVAIGPDQTFFIADDANRRIRRVAQGVITTVAGTGKYGYSGDGGSATAASPSRPYGVAVGPDGTLFLADSESRRIRAVGPALPGFRLGDFWIASEDGGELDIFSSSGRHLRTIEAATSAVVYSFGYDSAGQLASVTDRDGRVTTIERVGGAATAIVAPFAQRTVLSVDGNGFLSQITNPAGEVHRHSYGANGLMQTYADSRGNVYALRFDTLGRLERDENPAGGVKLLARSERSGGYSVTVTTALGRTTAYDVEALATRDVVRTITRPDGTATVTTSSPSGAQSSTGPDGTTRGTQLGPDPRFGMQAPVLSTTTRTPAGLSLSVVESRTATLVDPRDPFGVVSLVDTVTVNGRAHSTNYTAATRTSKSTTPAGRITTSVLDARGKVVQLRPPGALPLSLAYDPSGRLSTVTQGARGYSIDYDSQGYPQTLTDPLLRTVGFTYDRAGRVTAQSLPGNRTVDFGYDASGNVTSLTPPGRPAHGFGHTANDLTSSYAPPSAAGTGLTNTSYAYDLDGALAQVLLPDATTIAPGYDGAGRLTSLTTARGTTSFGYDTSGRVLSVGTPEGNWLTFGYDGFLRTSDTATGLAPGVVARTYDNDFRVASSSVNGSSVPYSYDADSLLTGAGALAISREAATGRVSTTTLGAVSTSQSYDASYGELSGFSASAGATTAYSYSLTRDLAGRITGKTETVQGVTDTYGYVYDDAGRLATVTRNGSQTASYLFDANGNRVGATTGAGTVSGAYDDQDRMTAYAGASYTYGPSGDLRTRTVGGQTTTWSYDALGNLLGAWLPDGRSIEYVIDGLNRRVGKKVNGVLSEGFLYDGQLRPAGWLDGAGKVYARFVYGTRVNVPEYMVTSAGTYRIVTDHLGSPRLVLNASTGVVAQRLDYDEWGRVLADSSPGFQPFGFAGGLYDPDTGLERFGARDYDPVGGRWTTKDRSRFRGGPNLYEYAGSDPINFIDPYGRMKLPANPSGLGPDWTLDPTHRPPGGGRYRHPSGDYVDFHEGKPDGLRGGDQRVDHWHHNGGKKHLKPGDEIPDPAPVCGEPAPEADPADDPAEDLEDPAEFSLPPPEVVVPAAITAIIIDLLLDISPILVF